MRADTICALSSGAGRAGVAVIRVSGPGARDAVRRVAGIESPRPRHAMLATLIDERDMSQIDKALVIWFPEPASFTGEPVAEFHLHGGRATVRALLDVLTEALGIRLAEPGEFTRRAFENGKMDLTEAEGLADLIEAETEAQRRQALRQLDGALGALYDSWRDSLVSALARLEAHIDFPDEDLPDGVLAQAREETSDLLAGVRAHLADNRRGERLREGVQVAILGAPNVGKSSLLNALARRDVAIVSEHAGTTRDVIEVHLDLGGFPVTFADTAGLRDAEDEVEREGVRRSLGRARDADLRIAMLDATVGPRGELGIVEHLDDATLPVVNKIDLVRPEAPVRVAGREALPISVATGEGLGALLSRIEAEVADIFDQSAGPALTRERHRTALQECAEALARAIAAEAPELIAEDLRLAARALGRITGRVDVEDILDVVFQEFCIGK